MKASKNEVPMCCNCKRGRAIPLTEDVICPIKGVVSASYQCKKYSFNLFLIKSKRRRALNTQEYSQTDFSISE